MIPGRARTGRSMQRRGSCIVACVRIGPGIKERFEKRRRRPGADAHEGGARRNGSRLESQGWKNAVDAVRRDCRKHRRPARLIPRFEIRAGRDKRAEHLHITGTPGGLMQRRPAHCIPRRNVCAGREQNLDDIRIIVGHGSMQRCVAGYVPRLQIGAGRHKRLDRDSILVEGRVVQRRSAVSVRHVHAGAGRHKRLYRGRALPEYRLLQGGVTTIAARIQFGAGRHQGFDDGRIAGAPSRLRQNRAAMGVPRIRVRPGIKTSDHVLQRGHEEVSRPVPRVAIRRLLRGRRCRRQHDQPCARGNGALAVHSGSPSRAIPAPVAP